MIRQRCVSDFRQCDITGTDRSFKIGSMKFIEGRKAQQCPYGICKSLIKNIEGDQETTTLPVRSMLLEGALSGFRRVRNNTKATCLQGAPIWPEIYIGISLEDSKGKLEYFNWSVSDLVSWEQDDSGGYPPSNDFHRAHGSRSDNEYQSASVFHFGSFFIPIHVTHVTHELVTSGSKFAK